MKTVLAPGAPWPNWEELNEQAKAKPKPKPKRKKPKPRIKVAISCDGLDFFAEARDQIASGRAKRNPNYYRKEAKTI